MNNDNNIIIMHTICDIKYGPSEEISRMKRYYQKAAHKIHQIIFYLPVLDIVDSLKITICLSVVVVVVVVISNENGIYYYYDCFSLVLRSDGVRTTVVVFFMLMMFCEQNQSQPRKNGGRVFNEINHQNHRQPSS